jgi:hypothetical protein
MQSDPGERGILIVYVIQRVKPEGSHITVYYIELGDSSLRFTSF